MLWTHTKMSDETGETPDSDQPAACVVPDVPDAEPVPERARETFEAWQKASEKAKKKTGGPWKS